MTKGNPVVYAIIGIGIIYLLSRSIATGGLDGGGKTSPAELKEWDRLSADEKSKFNALADPRIPKTVLKAEADKLSLNGFPILSGKLISEMNRHK